MSSSKNRFSIGLAFGVSLGLAISTGVVNAGSISQTYSTSTPVDTTMMNNVKTAVGDNDTRITAIGAGTQTCLTGMTRVGPTCVDTIRQAVGSSWNTAVNFCRAQNKRLLTPGEYIAAFNQAAVALGMDTNGDLEFVDAMFTDGQAANSTAVPVTLAGRLRVGYMGPSDGAVVTLGEIYAGVDADYDNATYGFFFRCAR